MNPQSLGTQPTIALADENIINLSALLGILLGARRLILGSVLVAMLAGGGYAYIAQPVYRVDAVVQVEDSKGGALGASLKDLEGLFESKSQATTEIELIRSRMVLGSAVDALGLDIDVSPRYFPIFGAAIARSYNELVPASAPFGLGKFAWGGEVLKVTRLLVPDAWKGNVLRVKAGPEQTFTLYGPDGALLGSGRVGHEFTSEAGQVGLFVRELRARPGTEFLISRKLRTIVVSSLAARLTAIEKGRQSGIIQLSLEGQDPVESVRVLNQIANNYVQQNVERRSAEAEQTLKYLDQQLPEIKKQLEAAEVRFNEFRARNGTVDVNKESELLLQQAVTTETGLLELEQRRKELLQRFTPEHPSVKALDSQIAGLRTERSRFANQVDSLPQTQQEVLRLTRDLQVSQEIYTGLLNNAQQLKVVRGGTVGNVRVIDYAERPLQPIKPKKSMILIMALLMGLFLGVLAAFIRQILRNGVKDPKQIEAGLGLSVFATIPQSPLQDQLANMRSRSSREMQVLAVKDDQDLAIESLRSLRTTLHFACLDADNNRLLITGPAPGVGKSFLSVNLAAVLVASGERVLLIDADMRRGHINEYFGGPREGGLSEAIAGTITLDEAVRPTDLDGLSILTTGAIPPNPSELLLHRNFSDLLNEVSGRYDRIIIDCPPVMAVTDAAIVGRSVSTVLVAARYAVTPIAELEASVKRLQQAGVMVNGVLLNGVTDEGGYGYGYGYKYAYGYSYRSKKD